MPHSSTANLSPSAMASIWRHLRHPTSSSSRRAPTCVFRYSSPRRPVSLYGRAKTQQELQAEYVGRTAGLEACIARLFNLLGPGRGLGTVVHDWISQIAPYQTNEGPALLKVRTLDTSRDFVDPRDAARALAQMAKRLVRRQCKPCEVFNVASGRSVSLHELKSLLESFSRVPIEVVESHPAPHSADVRTQRGDSSALQRSCGWQPRLDWQQSVREVWDQFGKGTGIGGRFPVVCARGVGRGRRWPSNRAPRAADRHER